MEETSLQSLRDSCPGRCGGEGGRNSSSGDRGGLLYEPAAMLPRRAAPLPHAAAGARRGGGSRQKARTPGQRLPSHH